MFLIILNIYGSTLSNIAFMFVCVLLTLLLSMMYCILPLVDKNGPPPKKINNSGLFVGGSFKSSESAATYHNEKQYLLLISISLVKKSIVFNISVRPKLVFQS